MPPAIHSLAQAVCAEAAEECHSKDREDAPVETLRARLAVLLIASDATESRQTGWTGVHRERCATHSAQQLLSIAKCCLHCAAWFVPTVVIDRVVGHYGKSVGARCWDLNRRGSRLLSKNTANMSAGIPWHILAVLVQVSMTEGNETCGTQIL